MDSRLTICVHDYCGHPFQLQLSRELAARGHRVLHLYCDSNPTTPKGLLKSVDNSVGNLSLIPIRLPRKIAKTALFDRWRLERIYGEKLVDQARAREPDILISANTPLDAQARLLNFARTRKIPFLFWIQDLLGEATYRILARRLLLVGLLIGSYYRAKEKKLLAQSDHLIPITGHFSRYFVDARTQTIPTTVISNWSPLNEVAPRPKKNPWSTARALDGKFVFLYSGSLGRKHNPALILALAWHMKDQVDVKTVVNSEGPAAQWLARQAKKKGLTNLIVNGFQPYECLSDVLASSNVLLGLLEHDAAAFSVPSKVLTYHCAQRPLLLAAPKNNLVSELISKHSTGIVVEPNDKRGFCAAAMTLYRHPAKCRAMGQRARGYAEDNFDITKITDRFEAIIQRHVF